MNNKPLFHIYIGTAYQGPQRARTAFQAVTAWASGCGRSTVLFHAVLASDAAALKAPRPERRKEAA